MVINKNSIELMNELYLHDMKLRDIKIDYNDHKVEISLIDPENVNHSDYFASRDPVRSEAPYQ